MKTFCLHFTSRNFLLSANSTSAVQCKILLKNPCTQNFYQNLFHLKYFRNVNLKHFLEPHGPWQPRTQALSSGKERPWSELVTWRLQNWVPKGVWAKCQITYASTSGFYTSIARSECSVYLTLRITYFSKYLLNLISLYFSIMIIC